MTWWNWVGKAVEEAGKHVGGAEDGLRAGIQRRNARMGRPAGARGGVSPYEGKAGMKKDDGSRPTPTYINARGVKPIEPTGGIPLDFSRHSGPLEFEDTKVSNQARDRITGGFSRGPFKSRYE